MFPKHHHYVPVLKWKRAEQKALLATPAVTKARLTPLVEIVPIKTDLDSGDQLATLEDHVDPAIEKMVSVLGLKYAYFLDPEDVAGDQSATGMGGAEYVFSEAQQLGLRFVPVTGLTRTAAETNAATKHKKHGLCLRVTVDDLSRPTLGAEITKFMSTNKLVASTVDIIVDFDSILGQGAFVIAAAIRTAVAIIPTPTAWRNLVIVASAFPESMGVVATLATMLADRTDWKAWTTLYGQRFLPPPPLARLPTFGDYGIQHPSGVEGFDPRFMFPAAAIRYTLADEWLLIKGQSTKAQTSVIQYPKLAKQLIAHPSFYGKAHCAGCVEAVDCANGVSGKGSLEAWRRIGTIHHLKVTTDQLAALTYP